MKNSSIIMSFSTDTLKYKAYTYTSSKSPIKITEESLLLVKKGNGYTVPENLILVKVHSAALNPYDLAIYNSDYFPFSSMFPLQGIGRDYSGVVEAIGEGDDLGLKVGDKVCGMYSHPFGKGTLAEYVVVDVKTDFSVCTIPENLTFEEATSWPMVYSTAYVLLDGIDVKNKKVLVLGAATNVGKYAISLAKLRGAKEIVTTNSSRSLEIVADLGSSLQTDYTKHKSILTPVLESVKDTGAFDAVLDCCGNSDLFSKAKTVIKPKGSYSTVVGDNKHTYGNMTFLGNIFSLLGSVWRLLGSKYGIIHYDYRVLVCGPDKRWTDEAKTYLANGDVKVFIDSVYKFNDLDKALEKLKSNKATGKIIVNVIDP